MSDRAKKPETRAGSYLSLVDEELLSWRDRAGGRHRGSLPKLLSRLAADDVADFFRARSHQQFPWLMFVSQIAHLATRDADAMPEQTTDWRAALLAMTDSDPAPWSLVVADDQRPAFLQAAVPDGSGPKKWSEHRHPDDLDILITSKDFDVKAGLIESADVEPWVYALCTLQTMQGFLGRGQYGISRMKKGFGNRPFVGVQPNLRASSAFVHAVATMRSTWREQLETHEFSSDGCSLVWTVPWDGETPLELSQLTPYYIEVCRRVRLVGSERGVHAARYAPSKSKRVAPGHESGDTGDPWIPRSKKDASALNVTERGFDYRLASELIIGGDFEPSDAQSQPTSDPKKAAYWVGWALPRGQGETGGLHERVIHLPPAVRRRLFSAQARDEMAERSKHFVLRADRIRKKVLYPALKTLAMADAPVKDGLHAAVDRAFFDVLFGSVEENEEIARQRWDDELVRLAQLELERAIESTRFASTRRYRAISGALAMFHGCRKKHFPDATWPPRDSEPRPEKGPNTDE